MTNGKLARYISTEGLGALTRQCPFIKAVNHIHVGIVENNLHLNTASHSICFFTLEISHLYVELVGNHLH